MISRPAGVNAYEFVVVAALRARQLLDGCTPRCGGDHTAATMAQMEVADGRVSRVQGPDEAARPARAGSATPVGAAVAIV